MPLERDSGFHVFALDHAPHMRTIRKRLEVIRGERSDDLLAGLAVDYADYRYRVGYLKALDEALRVCDEIERAERA